MATVPTQVRIDENVKKQANEYKKPTLVIKNGLIKIRKYSDKRKTFILDNLKS